jgi:asparagine synthase (glutamine-hydrolysing)
VCREARKYVRGVLTGDGADEFLLGYRFFQVERILGFIERISGTLPGSFFQRLVHLRNVRATDHSRTDILSILARGLQADADVRFYMGHAPFAWRELKDALTPDVWNDLADHLPFRELRQFLDRRNEKNRLRRAQLGVIFHFLQDVILTKVDRASMLHALEVRCPFLDADLVGFLDGLPLSMKLHWLTSKYILRRLAQGYLPREIVHRTKHGFWTPVRSLLWRELKTLAQDTLAGADLKKQRLFAPRFVEQIMKEHFARERDHSTKIWALLCFQLWFNAQATAHL